MKAVVAERFGGPDVLRLTEVPDPFTPLGCVRIAVHAAGLNPVDAGNRVDGTWAGLTAPCILGYDVAGVVDEVGEGADGALVGDRVMAMTAFPAGAGGYAEFAVVDAKLVAPVPPECSLVEAAGVPLAAGTAFEVLDRLELAAESSVLVLGASGGVGTFLVQLGAAAGLRIAAVGSEPSHSLLRELGATWTLDYRTRNVAEAAQEEVGGPVDAIVDLVGADVLQASLPAVRPHGSLAAIATPTLDLDPVLDSNLSFHGVLIENDPDRIRSLGRLLADGTFRSIVSAVFSPERASEAHQLLETGHSGGKIVLQFRS
ncbi:MAG TPA: NADP-dependent oxidoreductase [Gemmatimonadales bacterium]|nr:NADP-dependent oxidoreductase [Gemmatimonadales bacterium]